MTITSKYRLRFIALYVIAVLNIVALLGLTLTTASDETQRVCSVVDGVEDCGYVLPDSELDYEPSIVLIDAKELPGDGSIIRAKDASEAQVNEEDQSVESENTAIAAATPVVVEEQTSVVQEAVAPVQAPEATPQPVVSYVYPGAQGFSVKPMASLYNGEGAFEATDASTASYLSGLGYSQQTLWSAGIKIVGYQGLVEKNCAAGSTVAISGMAVKPVAYARCPSGEEVIDASYKTTGKCTIHYDASKNWSGTATGNSKAVLIHELAHCLHFIYAEYGQFDVDYKAARNIESFAQVQFREVVADDFMICRHGLDTSWGSGSYYNQYGVSYPSAELCNELNGLFNNYFPV